MRLFDRIFKRDKPLTWRRKLLIALLFAVPIVALFVASNRGLLTRFRLERQAGDLQDQIGKEEHASDSLRREIGKLKSDTLAIERVARERYGMVRPGESVYKVAPK